MATKKVWKKGRQNRSRSKPKMRKGGNDDDDIDELIDSINRPPDHDSETTIISYSSQNLTELPDISLYPNLKDLECHHNQLVSLPELPTSLQQLDCNNNKLISLPNLPNTLRILNCSFNKITSLPVLSNSLVELICFGNQLTSLPELPETLEKLICSFNQLTSLPVLPSNLITIKIQFNDIHSFPNFPISIRNLECDYNIMDRMPRNLNDYDSGIQQQFIEMWESNFHEEYNGNHVDPYQIHKESAKINYSKLIQYFKDQDIDDPPANINYPNFIRDALTEMIDATGNSEENKNGLDRIMSERLQGLNYQDFPSNTKDVVYYSLEFAKKQPEEFQKEYVNNFIKDCVTAYNENDPDTMTCVGGALERIFLSLIPASILYIDKPTEYQKYDSLVGILTSNPKQVIDEYIKEWYQAHKIGTPDAFPENTSDATKEASLKTFLEQKFAKDTSDETKALIADKIEETKLAITFDDDVFTYGGKRRKQSRTRKTKKGKQTRKKKNTKKT